MHESVAVKHIKQYGTLIILMIVKLLLLCILMFYNSWLSFTLQM